MKAEKQLSVRSTEAADLAEELARATGRSKKDLVRDGLKLLQQSSGSGPAKKHVAAARLARLRDITRRIRREVGPRATSNHDEFYDERGLPR